MSRFYSGKIIKIVIFDKLFFPFLPRDCVCSDCSIYEFLELNFAMANMQDMYLHKSLIFLFFFGTTSH